MLVSNSTVQQKNKKSVLCEDCRCLTDCHQSVLGMGNHYSTVNYLLLYIILNSSSLKSKGENFN